MRRTGKRLYKKNPSEISLWFFLLRWPPIEEFGKENGTYQSAQMAIFPSNHML